MYSYLRHMPFHDLQSYLGALEARGDLRRVAAEVDPVLEITEIATRMLREEGPALLFERVTGSPFPLAINFLASHRRIELVLGQEPAALGEALVGLWEAAQSLSPRRLLAQRRALGGLLAMRLRRVARAPVQDVVEPPDLSSLPVLQCWPGDAGRFITFGLVLTQHPDTGRRNLGVYRLQVRGPDTTGMHWQLQKGGGFHYRVAEEREQPLEVAVVLGGDPGLILAAVAPLPEGIDELLFSGLLRRQPLAMAAARSLRLLVPARAEFILEGEVRPRERAPEGPFGDHFGHYSESAPFPVFHVRLITRRARPVYPAAVVGKPPQEDRYLGEAVQMMLGPLLRVLHPELRGLWAYYEAGFVNFAVAAVAARYPKEALKTAFGLLGMGQFSLTKVLVLVNADVDPRDFRGVLRAIARHFDPTQDFTLLPRTAYDTLDFASFEMELGSKMVLDATTNATAPATPVPSEAAVALALRSLPEALAARLGAHVVATDIAPTMIERLTARTRAEGLNNLEGLVMDGYALDLDDDTFDVAGSQNGVSLFPDVKRGLAELVRVTKPGGRVLIVAFGALQRAEFLSFLMGAIKAAVPGFTGIPMDPPPLPFQLADPDKLRQELGDAGLTDVRVETVTWQMEFPSATHFLDWVPSSNPIGAGLVAGLTEEQKSSVQQVLDGMLRERSGGYPGAVLNTEINIGIGTK